MSCVEDLMHDIGYSVLNGSHDLSIVFSQVKDLIFYPKYCNTFTQTVKKKHKVPLTKSTFTTDRGKTGDNCFIRCQRISIKLK